MIKYTLPKDWIPYDPHSLASALAEAKASILSLKTIPYQRSWVEALQKIQLKMEVAGTSRIEGADFTEKELAAVMNETASQLQTRSQKQARAALKTYKWIADIPDDRPITEDLILQIHRNIVTDCDEDHCAPGKIRMAHQNVNFGQPRHRGAEGGEECKMAFDRYIQAIQREFKKHDSLIQAIAAHYHLAAMHPFLDGNGRTARALEALMLQKAGLKDSCFIAMSNYYYDEKVAYLAALSQVRANDHDLTPFLIFSLRGITVQSQRLLKDIQLQVSKALFKNLMYDLFNRLKTSRTRVIAERQIKILKCLLEKDNLDLDEIQERTIREYGSLKNPWKALIRDLNGLIALDAIKFKKIEESKFVFWINLEWPTQITETAFFKQVKKFPKAKTHSFLA